MGEKSPEPEPLESSGEDTEVEIGSDFEDGEFSTPDHTPALILNVLFLCDS